MSDPATLKVTPRVEGSPVTSDDAVPDWADFVPANARDAVGVVLIECGLFKDTDTEAVLIDWWLTDALIDGLRHQGWQVTPVTHSNPGNLTHNHSAGSMYCPLCEPRP